MAGAALLISFRKIPWILSGDRGCAADADAEIGRGGAVLSRLVAFSSPSKCLLCSSKHVLGTLAP